MKIAVIGANGKAGTLVVREATERGHEVTAIMRSDHPTQAQHTLIKDVFSLTRNDLLGFDAVVDAFGAWTTESLHQHKEHLIHLADVLSGTPTRLLVIGGAGSLYTDDTKTKRLVDSPTMPEEFKPLSIAKTQAYDALRIRDDVAWTYLSPALVFNPKGERTGEYQLAGDVLTMNAAGQSEISYADFAVAVVDLIESGEHQRERVSVVSR